MPELTPEQMEVFAAEHGLVALLDHLGLDGLGNEVDRLRAEVERLTKQGQRDYARFQEAKQGVIAADSERVLANADAERLAELLLRVENEELNGRLCPMPDFENEEAGCPKCRKLWADIRAALRQHEERMA